MARSRPHDYFYASREADLYDDTVELTQAHYHLLHDTMIELLCWKFEVPAVGMSSLKGAILDLGCGTGAEAIRVLKAFPEIKIVALDCSDLMLERFRKKLFRKNMKSFSRRSMLVCADFMGEGARQSALLDMAKESAGVSSYKAVISVFALHHLSRIEKRELYSRVYSVLEPGGVFLNGDLFSYQSERMAQIAEQHESGWLRHQFSRTDSGLSARVVGLGRKRKTLLREWLRHLDEDNKPIAIEGLDWAQDRRFDCESAGEVRELRRLGFSSVACPFRYFQAGILWAIK